MSKTSWLTAGLATVLGLMVLGSMSIAAASPPTPPQDTPPAPAPGAALVPSTLPTVTNPLSTRPVPAASQPALPAAVAKSFENEFSRGVIGATEEANREGVYYYDIKFQESGIARRAAIAADGTVLRAGMAVDANNFSILALAAVRKAAREGEILELQKVEVRAYIKDGKVVRFDTPLTNYSADLRKGNLIGTITVDEKGNDVVPVQWQEMRKGVPLPAKHEF